MPMELIDSHAHIDFPQFAEDREAMLDRARAAGVTTLLAIGTGPGPEKLDAALPYAEQHDWIYATVGIHPHEAKEVTQQHLAELARLAKHPKVIAWGEIGLDYYYDHSPRDVQHRVFRDQMALAQQRKLPIIIHCRDAWSDCLRMIDERWRPTGLGGILHCFTSTLEDARRGIEMGFLISFAGNSTYPKTQNLRDVAKELPLEKILLISCATISSWSRKSLRDKVMPPFRPSLKSPRICWVAEGSACVPRSCSFPQATRAAKIAAPSASLPSSNFCTARR